MRIGNANLGFPRPRGAVLWLLVVIFGIWLLLAVSLNWLGGNPKFIEPFLGHTQSVLHGQVWRLLTAAFIHAWAGDAAVSHVMWSLLALYFFGPALEARWGSKRFVAFVCAVAVFGYLCQTLVGALIPKLDQEIWIGGLAITDAIVIAWALQANPEDRVLLYFVLPVSPMLILAFTVGINVLKLIAVGSNLEGTVTPFGGMLAGYLLSDRSPLRRTWLRLRLRRLETRRAAMRSSPGKSKVAAHGLRVIRGGGDDPPKDKRWLN
jgi:membrane associated rhomboid family serine protease